jgi:hypothetical protein
MTTELSRATEVEALDGYVIRVTFSDGAVKEIDFSQDPSSARGVFRALRHPRIFSQARVNEASGTRRAPAEVDLDPTDLNERFEPAPGPPLKRKIRERDHCRHPLAAPTDASGQRRRPARAPRADYLRARQSHTTSARGRAH